MLRRPVRYLILHSHIIVCASSPIEFWSALGCLQGRDTGRPVFVTDQQSVYAQATLADCEAVAKLLYPEALFVRLLPPRAPALGRGKSALWWIEDYRLQLYQALGMDDATRPSATAHTIKSVYFSCFSHTYERVCLGLFPKAQRVLFPHGLGSPTDNEIANTPWLFQPRSWTNFLYSMIMIGRARRSAQNVNSHISKRELLSSFARLPMALPRTCVPYSGTDQVLTYRSKPPVGGSTVVTRVSSLGDTLRQICRSDTFCAAYRHWRECFKEASVMLLLSEYERTPIFKHNTAWLECYKQLVHRVYQKTGIRHFTIKAHPRSDQTAADFLAKAVRASMPEIEIELLPARLSHLPVELFAFDTSILGACSMGSQSLAPDIGLPHIPHYTSSSLADLFDSGWVGSPFWLRFGPFLRAEIREGFYQDLDAI